LTALGERLSANDLKRLEEDERRRLDEETQRVEELMASDQVLFRLPAIVSGPLVTTALVAVFALVSLFVLTQVISTLSALTTLPVWGQYLGWFALILLVSALLYAIGRFAAFYLKLKPNRPVGLRALAQLSQRTKLRWLVRQKKSEAKEQLEEYLRAYPLGDRAGLNVLGLTDERVKKLDAAQKELLDDNRFTGSDNWFDEFRTRFQVHLDTAADERIAYFAWRVGVMTALSPNALIDTLLTSYCSFSMLGDLCRVYNLRVNRLGTAVLLVRVFINAYISGQIKDWQDFAESGLQAILREIGEPGGSGLGLGGVGMKVVGKVTVRSGSGALNYFLLKRLGNYAAGLLRPVHGT
jgi:uncharacterized membrane protein YcjF (UPF0283 family)